MVILLRRSKEEDWNKHNPILMEGELVYVTDKKYFKIGDGETKFNDIEKKWIEAIPFQGSKLWDRNAEYTLALSH